MNAPNFESFPPEVIDKLGVYVYRLIDPRDGETFYVGKGKGNRVFAHIRAEQRDLDGDEESNKIQRIQKIRLAGLQVEHVIHRHGMDKETAAEVEAALIDAYPNSTNIVGGRGSSEVGVMSVQDVIRQYTAQEAEFRHRALLINVNRSLANKRELYDAVRFAWKIGSKAEAAEVVLAVEKGLIIGAFIPKKWMQATAQNFPGRGDEPDRRGFEGVEAGQELASLYVDKRVPDKYRQRGASNPIRYTW